MKTSIRISPRVRPICCEPMDSTQPDTQGTGDNAGGCTRCRCGPCTDGRRWQCRVAATYRSTRTRPASRIPAPVRGLPRQSLRWSRFGIRAAGEHLQQPGSSSPIGDIRVIQPPTCATTRPEHPTRSTGRTPAPPPACTPGKHPPRPPPTGRSLGTPLPLPAPQSPAGRSGPTQCHLSDIPELALYIPTYKLQTVRSHSILAGEVAITGQATTTSRRS